MKIKLSEFKNLIKQDNDTFSDSIDVLDRLKQAGAPKQLDLVESVVPKKKHH